MKKSDINSFWAAAVFAVMSLTMQSCQDEPYNPYTPSWFAGRSFAAYAYPGSYNALWVADFYNNGEFQISPCDSYGYIIPGMEAYAGTYSVDYNRGLLYLSYYDYAMNSIWTFSWWDQYDSITGTYPDMEIYTTSGTGPLDNLTFTPY